MSKSGRLGTHGRARGWLATALSVAGVYLGTLPVAHAEPATKATAPALNPAPTQYPTTAASAPAVSAGPISAGPISAGPISTAPVNPDSRAALTAETTSAPEATAAPEAPKKEAALGFEVALRLAAELPLGKADGGTGQVDSLHVRSSGKLGDSVLYGVPLTLDLGFRTSPHWWLGANFQAATGGFGKGCPDATRCAWSRLGLGASAVHFLGNGKHVPWLGLGLGWEWLRLWNIATLLDGSLTGSRELLGGPQLNLSGGLDFELASALRIGPYAGIAGGMYLTSNQLCRAPAQCESNSSVESHAIHAWVSLGVRGSYGP